MDADISTEIHDTFRTLQTDNIEARFCNERRPPSSLSLYLFHPALPPSIPPPLPKRLGGGRKTQRVALRRGHQAVRDSEREVKAILACREKLDQNVTLVTPYTDISREQRADSDDEEEAADEAAPDYLASFLPPGVAVSGRPLTHKEAQETRSSCLKVLPLLLVHMLSSKETDKQIIIQINRKFCPNAQFA